jgi:hypothetical protein
MASLTVKGQRASAHQVQNISLLFKIGVQMGCNRTMLAGALATMMQESSCINLSGGDRDSVGLYQQRPSCGWGSYAQCTTPEYAIRKFLTPYVGYCKQGNRGATPSGVIAASNLVQRSAYPTAPRQWYNESWRDILVLTAGKDIKDVTIKGVSIGGVGGDAASSGTDVNIVRDLPYEFSRGSPDKPENSWDCMGRLGDEVKWRRWMRSGSLWFASENYLRSQPVRYTFAQGVRGCLTIEWSADSRRDAADCTVTALARRWSVTPGDVVRVENEGPADGLWIVKSTRRSIDNSNTEIALTRPTRKAIEPAPQTETKTVHVSGVAARPKGPTLSFSGYNIDNATTAAAKAYAAAQALSAQELPYSQARRNLVEHMPSSDCSSGVSWVLLHAGIRLPGGVGAGQWAPVSGDFEHWGLPGRGKYMTIMCNAGHIWIRWHGMGAWRFDTSSWGDPYTASSGGRNRRTARSTSGFVQRHWPGT